jgi:hypothetical protein
LHHSATTQKAAIFKKCVISETVSRDWTVRRKNKKKDHCQIIKITAISEYSTCNDCAKDCKFLVMPILSNIMARLIQGVKHLPQNFLLK